MRWAHATWNWGTFNLESLAKPNTSDIRWQQFEDQDLKSGVQVALNTPAGERLKSSLPGAVLWFWTDRWLHLGHTPSCAVNYESLETEAKSAANRSCIRSWGTTGEQQKAEACLPWGGGGLPEVSTQEADSATEGGNQLLGVVSSQKCLWTTNYVLPVLIPAGNTEELASRCIFNLFISKNVRNGCVYKPLKIFNALDPVLWHNTINHC